MDSQHDESPGASGPAFADAFSERLAAGLGRRARLARRERRMTQADVADRLGVTTEFYARIERGHALPSVTTLARLVDTLDLALDAIIERAADGASPDSAAPHDPLPLRRVLRRLRRTTPAARALVIALLEALDVQRSPVKGSP